MAVVVQHMVVPHAAGILFTADPVTSNRRVAVVEASFGLGEAVVSGLVNADTYQVRDGEIVASAVAAKRLAIHAVPGGGTEERGLDPDQRDQPALTDAQVVRLVELGRRIEAHFGCPQDIEWCLDGERTDRRDRTDDGGDDGLRIVQSRPITTLFPIPGPSGREDDRTGDGQNHVYVSVGHQQMMTDPMKPLGLSLFQLTALPPMHEAGGRLFVDVTLGLGSPASRAAILGALGRSDPLIGDALQTLIDRDGFLPSLPDGAPGWPPRPVVASHASAPLETDPAIVTELIRRTEAAVATVRDNIATKSGSALIEFILADISELKALLFDPLSQQVIMAGMEATWWLNDQLLAWLGEKERR